LRALSLVCGPSFRLSSFHFPASLRSTVITRFVATTDALTPAGRFFGPAGLERRLPPAGLPDYRRKPSDPSVSNHRCADRGPPGCPAIRLAAYRPRCRLRHLLADSPNHTDRIEFTTTLPADGLCYGLVVLSPLLSTPPCGDAVTVRYRTILHRTKRTFTALTSCLLRRTSAGL